MEFKELLDAAQSGDNLAMEQLLKLYQPMLTKQSTIDGVVDQDVYSELCDEFVSAVREFRALIWKAWYKKQCIRKPDAA